MQAGARLGLGPCNMVVYPGPGTMQNMVVQNRAKPGLDHATYGRVSWTGTMQNAAMHISTKSCKIWSCFKDHATSVGVFWHLNSYSRGPCFQAQINIIGFYLGSPARQKQSTR